MAAGLEGRVKRLEGEVAARASQKKDKPSIDYSKLSDAALEEIRACFDDSGVPDYGKLSTETLEEIEAARIEP